MSIDELRNGIEYNLDGEKFRILLDGDRERISEEFAPIIVFYSTPDGLYRQESWVNSTIQDESLLRFLCIDVRRLARRKLSE